MAVTVPIGSMKHCSYWIFMAFALVTVLFSFLDTGLHLMSIVAAILTLLIFSPVAWIFKKLCKMTSNGYLIFMYDFVGIFLAIIFVPAIHRFLTEEVQRRSQ